MSAKREESVKFAPESREESLSVSTSQKFKAAKRIADLEKRVSELQKIIVRMGDVIETDSKRLNAFLNQTPPQHVTSEDASSINPFDSRRGHKNGTDVQTMEQSWMRPFASLEASPNEKLQRPMTEGGRHQPNADGDKENGGKKSRFNFRDIVLKKLSEKKQETPQDESVSGGLGAEMSVAFAPDPPTSEPVPQTNTAGDDSLRGSRASSPAPTSNAHRNTIAALPALTARLRQLNPDQSFDIDGPFMSFMDVLFIVSAVLSSIFVIAMWHPRSPYDFDESPPMWFTLWLAGTYAVSFVWMYLRFFIRCRNGDWEVIDDLPSIRKSYLKSWFLFDLIYTIPVDLIFVSASPKVFFILILRHFLRYPRLLTLGRSVNPLIGSRMWFGFVTYLGTMVLMAHIVGSIFWSVQGQNNDSLTYVQSLYWAVASMTSVGYGDFVATTDNGRVFSCVAMFLGVCMIATFSAWATAFILDKDAIRVELENRKALMHSMLKYYEIPWDIQREVIQVMPAALNKSTETHFRQELDLLPHFVQSKLLPYFNAHQLKEIPLFADANEAKVLALSQSMKQLFFQRNELIFAEGDKATEILFISHGIVELLVGDGATIEVVQQLRDGRWFGEEIFKSDEVPLRSVTAQAVTNCELISLDKESLAPLIAEDTRVRESILVEHRNRKLLMLKCRKAARRRASIVALSEVGLGVAGDSSKGPSEVEEDAANEAHEEPDLAV